MAQLDELLGAIPPVTKCYLILAFLVTGICSVDIITPFDLYLNWNLVLGEFQVHSSGSTKELLLLFQIWRLFTCFLFFGEFKLHVLWNLYML